MTLSDNGSGAQPQLMSYLGFPSDPNDKITTPKKVPLHNTSSVGPPTTNKKRRSAFAPLPPISTHTKHAAAPFNCSLISQLSTAKPMLVTAQKVFVSHIDTPHQFYVQTLDYHASAAALLDACKVHARSASAPQHIEAGAMYLLRVSQTSDTGAWHRVRVMRAEAGSDCGAADVEYEVLYLDYGKRDRVKGSGRFRTISVELATKPAGARSCSLHSLRPLEDEAWRKDAKVFMSTIIGQ